MIVSFFQGVFEGISQSVQEMDNKSRSSCRIHQPPPPPPKKKQVVEYAVPLYIEIEREPSAPPCFPASSSQEHKQAKKHTSNTTQKQPIPSNIKEFTLPDGSVIYINTDKTEMEVNDASDYFK